MVPPTRPLTKRQLQILGEVANGRSNPEIGGDLYLTEDTIKSHMRHINRILGVRNRAHAVAVALTAGLLPATTVQVPSIVTPQREQLLLSLALQHLGHQVRLTLASGEWIRCELAAVMPGPAIGVFALPLRDQRRYLLREIDSITTSETVNALQSRRDAEPETAWR